MFHLSLRSLRICSRAVFTIFSLGVAVIAGRADASTVTITVTGTVYTGTDYTNVFGLGTSAGLSGQQFNLVYTFDDTKGQQTVTQPPGTSSPCGSTIQNVGLSNPGTAVLQIGKGTWTFGQLSGDVASSLSERVVGACLGTPSIALDGVGQNDGVASSVADSSSGGTPYSSVDSVETTIMLASGTFPATGLSWENALSNSQFLYNIALINESNAFGIAVYNEQTGMVSALATGTLTPTSITVSGAGSPPPVGPDRVYPASICPHNPMPHRGYAQSHRTLWWPRAQRWLHPGIRYSPECVLHSSQCDGLLVECHRGPQRLSGLSHRLAHRSAATNHLHVELRRTIQSQCGHRAGRDQRRRERLRERSKPSGPGYLRLLRTRRNEFRAGFLSANALPGSWTHATPTDLLAARRW